MSKITVPFTGGCACGAIRYECTAEPIVMLKCHCRNCQHVTGDGFAAAVVGENFFVVAVEICPERVA